MSETDPFTDAAFTGRLQKLLSLLGSEQPAEAEAARRKIAEHLAHHRLSFTDLAQHFQGLHARPPVPSFTQGAREMSLERQLSIARATKEEVAREAAAALHRVRVLEVELQQATFEIGRTLNSQARVRVAAAIACIVAAASLIFVVLPRDPQAANTAVRIERPAVASLQNGDPEGNPARHLAPGEILGHAAVQDLAIRQGPSDEAAVRTFLNMGDPVAIGGHVQMGTQTWLRVRAGTAGGWVRSGDVIR